MADRFDVIEAGGRGRRRWVGVTVVVALVVICAVNLLNRREPAPMTDAEGPTPAPIRSLTRVHSEPNILTAPATREGGDRVLRVVFPDGARGEVRYPAELGLAEMGSRPFWGGWVDGRFRQFVAPYLGEVEITRGGQPIRNFTSNVTLWPRQAGGGSYGQVLLFAFGPWRLAVHDRGPGLTFEQRMTLARQMKGRVTKDGYLVLSAGKDVRLAPPGTVVQGYPAGPQLWFGGGMGELVALVPTPGCASKAKMPAITDGRGRRGEMVCRGDVLVAVTGPPEFRRTVLDDLRITLR
ncbi:hypothetical protein ABZW11_10120 [Nonomuraea sp. NPDC004580]|uniref:hypothetical protein n=1 Tax=Nonomuraea sp. NPDC004580 TaxID=3154552 RepID=UPI0033AB4CC9